VNNSQSPINFYMPCGLIANSWFYDSFALIDGNNGAAVQWQRSGITWPSDSNKFKNISPSYLAQYPNATGTYPPNVAFLVPPGSTQFPVTNEVRKREILSLMCLTFPLFFLQDFIVWMRVAGLPTFRKLYAIIPQGLPVGSYQVVINNIYATSQFGNGTKSVVLTSTSFLGGYNTFLGYAYIAVGSVCLALALVFFIVNLISPRKLGDPALLSWNKGA
jgi:hypothetical protein